MQLKPGDVVRRTRERYHPLLRKGLVGTVLVANSAGSVRVFVWALRKKAWWARATVEKVDAA